MMISAAQIKAARMILDWHQDELAVKCDLSRNTIRSLEMGNISTKSANIVRSTFEAAGLEFLEDDGVKRRSMTIIVQSGHASRNALFAQLWQAAHSRCGAILFAVQSFNHLTEILGGEAVDALSRLEQLCKAVDVKCLLLEEPDNLPDYPRLQCRVTTQQAMGAAFYTLYDDTYINIVRNGANDYMMVAYHLPLHARNYRAHFTCTWETASLVRARSYGIDRYSREKRLA